jgi:methenyltetrahydrofolate cyclohydrolase
MIRDQRIHEYLDRVASADPTPGGGAAAAVSAATGAALVAMVARLTIGKEEFADVEPRMRELHAEAEGARAELLALADRDAEAFESVMEAFRMPKETPEGKTARSAAIQEGFRRAAAVPLEVARRSVAVLEVVAEAIEKGNPNAASDGGSAAQALSAGANCALYNVEINLGSIKDPSLVGDMTGEVANLRARAEQLLALADTACRRRIAG